MNGPKAPQVSTEAKPGTIVIVEPGAGNKIGGHMREKLFVFTQRLKERDIPFHVFSWLTPIDDFPASTAVADTWLAKLLLPIVPKRFFIKTLEFLTYRAAFSYAARKKLPVMGLTTSSPWGLVLARLGLNFTTKYAQRILYVGLHDQGNGFRVRKVIMGAFQFVLGANGTAVFNTPLPNEMFIKHRPFRRHCATRSCVIVEPIFDTTARATARDRENTLLCFGPENARRTPIRHLYQAHLTRPFSRLILHEPGEAHDPGKIELLRKTVAPQIDWSNDYVSNIEFSRLFQKAKYCLVAYVPFFVVSSSILSQSIVCGLPVLTSNFPDSRFLATFGKIGEFFEYGDTDLFQAAIHRLLAWTESDWQEFAESRARIMEVYRYDRVVDQCLQLLVQESSTAVKLS